MSLCIEACGSDRKGYGVVWLNHQQRMGAHRWVWEQAHGPIPDGVWVLHHCDNPRCINIEHLWLGTARDNARDMVAKGRGVNNAGERHGLSTLTPEAVREIRRRAADGESQKRIATDFGITQPTVSKLLNRRRWKHLEEAA